MADRLTRHRVPLAVVAVAALGLLARLVLLDARVAHWDEARVGWWVLQFLETGTYQYYPILHGPLLFHVNRWLFAVLGPTDFAARLFVALVGGALPLSALALRTRLDGAETVALAVVLAADPLLLYYSRFARNDLLVAGFAFVVFALVVRAYDTGRVRHAVVAAPVLALAFGAKENAILYVCCWVGAAWLTGHLDERAGTSLGDLRGHARAAVRVGARQLWFALAAVRRHPLALVAGTAAFLAVTVVLYAPRGGTGPSLGRAVADPSLWPAVVAVATLGAAEKLVGLWLLGGLQKLVYPWFLFLLVLALLIPSLAVVALAGYGLATEYPRPRPLVVFTLSWAMASLLGYPLAVDFVGGWTAIHVVVPLAVPAAVGLAALGQRGRPALASLREGASPSTGGRRAVVALVVLTAHVVAVGGLTSYAYPGHQENVLGQPAQGGDDLKPTVELVVAVATDNDGVDVAFYGGFWAGGVQRRQPVAWYLRAADHGASGPERVRTVLLDDEAALAEQAPPVVVALSYQHADVTAALDGYACFAHELDYWVPREPGGRATETYVYVEEDALERAGGREAYGSTRSSHRCG